MGGGGLGQKVLFRASRNLIFVYLVKFEDWGRRVSLIRFRLVVSDVDPGNKDFMCKRVSAKMFLRVPRDAKLLLRSSISC